ncbi:MAG: SufE family protein [Bacteroidales bacterium]|jgi:cysteine desulfuration protein SufE|nr:Fe-S metabolism protein SufE [Lentimicrobiaceae bacterium]MDG1136218.1 SufE family protein [Bacteroidales bacterium]MDG1902321.1 SufE family protein [Bacteroidales bacterium]MDG2081301.1 SufE family protein [Bacteroidales bacterium]|tara:strand:+ start:1975 stop:2400 length:426 start_codon:yes stop_codon:yes gene_type:complete
MTIKEKSEAIVEEFAIFDDWMDKYAHLIELGKELPIIDEKYKDESHLISGCQSRVWLHADYVNDNVVYTADSDAVITKGIISLLIRVMSDANPSEIYSSDFTFIDDIGLSTHLSPTRANGLVSMVKQMKLYAKALYLRAEK